jgi:hypothetical protein
MLLRCESLETPMSQLGQERRIRLVCNTSALPPEADIGADIRNRRDVPRADICTAAKDAHALASITGDEGRRDGQATYAREEMGAVG